MNDDGGDMDLHMNDDGGDRNLNRNDVSGHGGDRD